MMMICACICIYVTKYMHIYSLGAVHKPMKQVPKSPIAGKHKIHIC